MEDKKIALNFFSLDTIQFSFSIYRKPYQAERKDAFPTSGRYRLPTTEDPTEYSDYWVSFTRKEGFQEFICSEITNIYLTKAQLFETLVTSCKKSLKKDSYSISKSHFNKRIFFKIGKPNSLGQEEVWLEPYYLKCRGKFGFLVDFKFNSVSDKVSRETLRLSLSLDKNYKENKDFYIDRYEKIQIFTREFHDKIFPLILGRNEILISKSFTKLESNILQPKKYIVGKEATANSQFLGVKSHGPLTSLAEEYNIFFIFEENNRLLSRDLYKALQGNSFNTFSGMEGMFGFQISPDNVTGIPVNNWEIESIKKALKLMKEKSEDIKIIAILITPFSKFDENSDKYFEIKHYLLMEGVTSQFIYSGNLKNHNQLKWAIGNIGLGLFAKMGGQPWKVTPKSKDCLIIGLGQSHRKINHRIEKYFAYTILTESTGLYKDLHVLSDDLNHSSYIDSFSKNLKEILLSHYDNYHTFMVHSTFSIRREELDAVQQVLNDLNSYNPSDQKKFVHLKFNEKSKFFGYSTNHNSMVPFESSYVQLSYDEFLVWFEGLQFHKSTIHKRIGRPMHIKFLFPEHIKEEDSKIYLQDAINLSGANWRGFNAKSLPISVYYANLVAKFIKEFQRLELDDVELSHLTPWFL